MRVFKGYMQIVRRNLAQLLMYVMIFIGVTLGIQRAAMSQLPAEFAAVKVPVAVIDRDGGVLADAVKSYMEKEQKLVEIADDEQTIQEELYYRNVQYVVVIPEGAQEKFADGETALQVIKVPASASGYYLDAKLEVFLGEIRTAQAGGFSLEEACEIALSLLEERGEVTMMDVNGNNGQRAGYNYFFAYLPYGLLGGLILCIGVVVMEFKKKEIRRRMTASCVPLTRQNLAAAGCFLTVGVGIWLIILLLQTGLYRGGIFASPHCGYYLLNSFLCMLTALSLAYFAGMLAGGPTALNGISNVLSLGLCFLGGIFVPLEMLDGKVSRVAQFLPTWWYSKINGILGDYGDLSPQLAGTVRMGLLIQFLFALTVFAVTMAIVKARRQEE